MREINWARIKKLLIGNKVLIFPLLLFVCILGLSSFKISGSSIGIYHNLLYGENTKDPNLLLGRPNSLRSDEWLVNTQMTIAQEQNNFERYNNFFSEQKDMSILFDAPYKEWSVIFKPQNLPFFIIPFEHAFAFKWWFMLFLLMASAYFFCLKLLPGKIWIAIASSIIIACSPFVFWWYLNGTIAPLAYGFLVILISTSIIDGYRLQIFKKKFSQNASLALKISALSYILICFALLLYPPFQIPVAVVVAFFILGYLANTMTKKPKKALKSIFLSFLVVFSITVAVCAAYVLTRADVIHTITNTAYPGKRSVASGGYDVKKLLTTYLQPQLQRGDRAKHYEKNQSESSSFILLPLYFILPALILLIWVYVKKGKIEWLLLSLLLCCMLLLAQLLVPHMDLLTNLFLLHLVPLDRLVIGLGFLALILLIYMVKVGHKYQLTLYRKAYLSIFVYSLAFFGLLVWAGLEISALYPGFISSKKLILLLAITLAVSLGLILANRLKVGMTILTFFNLASVVAIHPLYSGMGPIYRSSIESTIKELSSQEAVWGAAQNLYIENIPQMSGRKAVTGVSAYPSNNFWKEYSGIEDDFIYNRYAHVLLSSNDQASLMLIGPDFFTVPASCQRKIGEKIDYIISTTPLEGSCNKLVRTLPYPNTTFYFYRQ